MSEGTMIAFGECIRCGTMFAFDPETVPSVSVHEQTQCCLRPDHTQVVPGEPNTYRAPLCPPCESVFKRPGAQPVAHLFPHARLDLS